MMTPNSMPDGMATRRFDADHFNTLRRFAERWVDDGWSPRVRLDPELTGLLQHYRSEFQEQVVHDFAANREALRDWAERLRLGGNAGVERDLARLEGGQQVFLDVDQWSNSRHELLCWNTFQQFYCDALALADRLLRVEHGVQCHRRRRTPRRHERPGAASDRWDQALLNLIEQAFPNVFALEPLRGALPILAYQASRQVFPRPGWRSLEYLNRAHRMVTSGALASLTGGRDRGTFAREGIDQVLRDPYFFNRHTGRTRHNLIFALSHRHSFLDLGLMYEVFRGRPFATWSNIQYFPPSAARDPLIVAVRPGESRRMEHTMQRSAELVIDQGLPLTSYVDGGAPYLPYGQQMRVKPGVRLLVDFISERARGTRRKTYLVPVSFDDTISFIRGLDAQVRLVMHRPISSDAIDPAPRRPDRGSVNRGDPLLIHLEALLMAHTGQVRHGWQTPPVIAVTRQFAERMQHPRRLADTWRRCFHASICDLSRAGGVVS